MSSAGGPAAGAPTRVFAQPQPARLVNVVALLALGLLVSGLVSLVAPSPLSWVLIGVIAVIAVWIAVGSLFSRITLSDETLVYRGVLRSRTVARDRVVALSEPGARPATLWADVPVLVWRGDHEDLERTTLWCLPLGMSASARGKVSETPRDAFRTALGAPGL